MSSFVAPQRRLHTPSIVVTTPVVAEKASEPSAPPRDAEFPVTMRPALARPSLSPIPLFARDAPQGRSPRLKESPSPAERSSAGAREDGRVAGEAAPDAADRVIQAKMSVKEVGPGVPGMSPPAFGTPPVQRKNMTGLPEHLKEGVEALSGIMLDDVRVHFNSAKPAAVQALAYAQGTNIHVAPGQEKHLPHEAWHIVQQQQGRVKPTVHARGVAINDDPALEREADAMGGRAAAQRVAAAGAVQQRAAAGADWAYPIQRVTDVFTDQAATAYSNPTDYLKGKGAINRVVEEPGSLGILGAPDMKAINAIADDAKRVLIEAEIDKRFARLLKKQSDAAASAKLATGDAQAAFAKSEKDAENQIAKLTNISKALKGVTSKNSAAIVYRQHTKALSDLGLSPLIVQQAGTPAAEGHTRHVFHKDAGFIKVTPETLSGGKPQKKNKADALNGPWNKGWVKGHNNIDNMKHRFIEHIHVNKGTDQAIDIYNSTAAHGEVAEAWPTEKRKPLLSPSGDDETAVNDAIKDKNDADLASIA